jgi:aryl-alcohol dehydrogenase (NADP+)
MQYVNLGSSGLKVSRLCFGTMGYGSKAFRPYTIEERGARPHYKLALDLGINFFDTADVYSLGRSEEITGKWLLKYAPRHELVIATKLYGPMSDDPNDRGLSRKHAMDAIDKSLARLGTDYVDLYQIHRFDYETPIEETVEALHDVVKAGKARYIGASSMFAFQFAKMLQAADLGGWTRFVSMQNHYNLIYREEEREMMPLCQEEGIGVIPWSPLARGFLAGNRYRRGGGKTPRSKGDPFSADLYYQPEDFEVVERVLALAKQRGVSPTQIALAWMLHKPYVTAPIIGASKLGQLRESVKALDIDLEVAEMALLEEPYRPHAVRGHTPYPLD